MKTIEIEIPVNGCTLKGNLNIPKHPTAIVVFAHGSGSSRFSKRNIKVASLLNDHNIATILTDLLSFEEDKIYENRFDIDLLTKRLVAVTKHIAQLPELKKLPIAYFGASTGAASALKAAAQLSDKIYAVVSRGGRPDLAFSDLKNVKAPTLLIVGSLDDVVIELNLQALKVLNCEKHLETISGATHLFEEPGKLNKVAEIATAWIEKYTRKPKTSKHDLQK
jgi:pimeloyl-ACP methyl ester carboxylesterase